MKMRLRSRPQRAFTLIDLCVVVAVLAVIAALLLPALAKTGRKSARIGCVNNLKQVGLSFRIFATDHGDRTSMQAWANQVDRMVGSPLPYFVGMSNELSTLKVLVCPTDTRSAATSLTLLNRSNVSYFVGLDATETFPQMLLAGDRNLTTNGVPVGPGLQAMTTNSTWGWGQDMHRGSGNVVLGDGSVQQTTGARLRDFVRRSVEGTNWLAVP